MSLQFHADNAVCFLHAAESRVIRHATAIDQAGNNTVLLQLILHLRTRAVYQHHPNLQAHQHIDVVRQLHHFAVGKYLAAERDHDGALAEFVDERRGATEPLDESFEFFCVVFGHASRWWD